jgi:photosystem II stability/assembly factor-like uncharacterized protein
MKHLVLFLLGITWAYISQAQNLEWKELNTPVKASLRGLSPVSGKVCWASGSGGTWLRTIDGGLTWEHGVVAGLDSLDFRSIHAFDEQQAVVASAGQPAVIYRTDDGGKSWTKVHEEGEEAFLDGICFSDTKTGYIVGDPVDGKWMILETKDAGRTWHSLDALPDAKAGEAAFAASASSIIVTKKGLLLGTGGSVSNLYSYQFAEGKWNHRLSPLLQGEASQGIFALVEAGKSVVGVGGDYTKPEMAEKNAFVYQLGEFALAAVRPSGYRSGVTFWKRKNMVLSVGPSGSDFSKDGGMSWENFSSIGFHAVKLSLDKTSIWASGSDGRIGILVPSKRLIFCLRGNRLRLDNSTNLKFWSVCPFYTARG